MYRAARFVTSVRLPRGNEKLVAMSDGDEPYDLEAVSTALGPALRVSSKHGSVDVPVPNVAWVEPLPVVEVKSEPKRGKR